MNLTSRWLLADTGSPVPEREGSLNWVGLRHTLFGIAYAAAVIVSLSVVYFGTHVAIVWPSIGIPYVSGWSGTTMTEHLSSIT